MYTACFLKTVPSVYTILTNTLYLSQSTQLGELFSGNKRYIIVYSFRNTGKEEFFKRRLLKGAKHLYFNVKLLR